MPAAGGAGRRLPGDAAAAATSTPCARMARTSWRPMMWGCDKDEWLNSSAATLQSLEASTCSRSAAAVRLRYTSSSSLSGEVCGALLMTQAAPSSRREQSPRRRKAFAALRRGPQSKCPGILLWPHRAALEALEGDEAAIEAVLCEEHGPKRPPAQQRHLHGAAVSCQVAARRRFLSPAAFCPPVASPVCQNLPARSGGGLPAPGAPRPRQHVSPSAARWVPRAPKTSSHPKRHKGTQISATEHALPLSDAACLHGT